MPCLVGATAVGKSDVAIALARRVGGEVIACDALTVYRGVDVLTAKPAAPPDVPHHLLGGLEPHETYSAGRFVADCDRVVEDVLGRGRVPLVVGGTALYLVSWLHGMGAAVARDERLRAELEALADREGTAALAARLRAQDPQRAAEVHEHDRRRLVRALEIVEATGRPASEARGQWAAPPRRAAAVVGLRRGDDDLRRRVEARARAMLDGGALEEVAALDAAPRPPSRELAQAIGLADVRAVLAGLLTREACAERLARATWRFTRRQRTFFRRLPVQWLDVAQDEPPATTAARVHDVLRAAAAVA